jgi:phage shock protein PspC (stress-responsive transcriptional regulator)
MNKTITINIAGIVFHIDESAYESLKQYLSSVKGHFAGSQGGDEIISDIELRIAEMFQARLHDSKQVILSADVEEMIRVMGRPEDFGDEETSGGYEEYRLAGSNRKRLFRDPDDKILGGVCSGISAYLGIDPVWLRLAFAIAFFAFGSGLLLYIVLWIILPLARTTAEKLQMRGEQVNVENIERSIKEEIEGVKTRFRDFRDEARGFARSKYSSGLRGFTGKLVDAVTQIFTVFIEVLLKITAVLFVLVGICVLIGLLSLLTGMGTVSHVDLNSIYALIFDSLLQKNTALISLSLIIGIPFFMLLYKGVKMLFNIKVESRALRIISATLWIVGIFLGIYSGVQIGKDFKYRQIVRKALPVLQPASNTLYLQAADSSDEEFRIGLDHSVLKIHSEDEKVPFRLEAVRLDIVRADSDNFELIQVTSARGRSRSEARSNAERITYSFAQKDSTLRFNSDFILGLNEKYRGQKIKLILKVPVNKEVVLDPSLETIIYDIHNVSDTYDTDMLGFRWRMTHTTLKCVDCDEGDAYDYSDERKDNSRRNKAREDW